MPLGDIRVIKLLLQNGDLRLYPGPPDEILVLAEIVQADLQGANAALQIRPNPGNEPIQIALPEDIRVEIELGEGNILLSRTVADARIRLQRGNVQIEGAKGAFNVEVETGSIRADLFLNRSSRFQVGQGDIRFAALDHLSKPLQLLVEKGDIRAAFTEQYGAALEARAPNGVIQSQLPLEARVNPSPAEKGSTLKGSIGGGGPILAIETGSGNIFLQPLETRAERAEAAARFTAAPPRIDGALEAEWLSAPLYQADGGEESGPFQIRLMRDEQTLYIALISSENDWSGVRLQTLQNGDPNALLDDRFQIEAVVDDGTTRRLVFNAAGALLSAKTPPGGPDLEWRSGAAVRTEIYPGAWTAEIAVPAENIGWSLRENETALLYISRIRPEREQTIRWRRGGAAVRMEPAADPGPTAKLLFHGLERIPEAALRQAAGLPATGGAPIRSLHDIEQRIQRLQWFQNARLHLEAPDDLPNDAVPVSVVLSQPNAFQLQEIDIVGASAVPANELADRLGWKAGWTNDAQLEARRQLTETLFKSLGYAYCDIQTLHDRARAILRVDEGFIAKLNVVGAELIPSEEIAQLLSGRVGRTYHFESAQTALQKAAETLSERFDSFQSLEDGGAAKEGPLRVWTVRVRERPPLQIAWTPNLQLNHIHGVEIGAGAFTHRGRRTRTQLFFDASYVVRNRARGGDKLPIHFRIGAAAPLTLLQHEIRAAAEWSTRSRTHPWQEAAALPSLDADRFHTEEALLHAAKPLFERLLWQARVGAASDETLLQSFWSTARLVSTPPNPPVDDGQRLYARTSLALDLRDAPAVFLRRGLFPAPKPSLAVRKGLWASFSVEGGRFAPEENAPGKRRADWTYSRAWVDARAYLPLGRRLHFSARTLAQLSADPLPKQLQASFGPDSMLRSRGYADIAGESGWAASANLRADFGSAFASLFADAAAVWSFRSSKSDSEQAVGAAVGWKIARPAGPAGAPFPETIRVEAALPLSAPPGEERPIRLRTKLGLPF